MAKYVALVRVTFKTASERTGLDFAVHGFHTLSSAQCFEDTIRGFSDVKETQLFEEREVDGRD